MRILAVAWLGLALLTVVLAAGDLHVPGPNYDEVIQAVPSVEFLEGRTRGPGLPGSRVVHLLDRPLPWMTQPYMGALKSQLLLPVFATLGGDLFVLRLTTIAWSALGILLSVAFARRAFGTGVALVAGLLLACDPSLLFISRHDWGSFSLGLLLRCASLLLVALWWERGKLRYALLAGAALGLGVYNKVDFAVFPVAVVLALLVAGRGALADVIRERRAHAAAAIATAALFALPVLMSLPEFTGAAGRFAQQAQHAEKWNVLGSVLDGSYFLRLMRVGGRFDAMFPLDDVSRGGLGAALVLVGVGLAAGAVRRRSPPGSTLLLLCGFFLALLLFLLPGAVRAHHVMNLYPFPHWIVAVGILSLWRDPGTPFAISGRRRVGRRLAAGIVLLALVATNLRVVAHTHADLERSGGRGYWSGALVELVGELAGSRTARVVCLDWGFHNQVAFLGEGVRSVDALWQVRRALARGEAWTIAGDAATVYLIHPEVYDLFGLGGLFQAALADLPAGRIEVRPYVDREGSVAFLAVRFEDVHRVRYDGRRFAIRLQRAAPPRTPRSD